MIEISKLDFSKNSTDIIPCIIQDFYTKTVLMLGYMNNEAIKKTLKTKKVHFYSRSKKKLWLKGETSKNYLNYIEAYVDCDKDTILIIAKPDGPTCHKGTNSCFNYKTNNKYGFFSELEKLILERKNNKENSASYISNLFKKGVNKISQKVGEEATETIIEAIAKNDELFLEEVTDLLFHTLILLVEKNKSLEDIEKNLIKRNKK